jgi:hypothetical protein
MFRLTINFQAVGIREVMTPPVEGQFYKSMIKVHDK